MSLINSNNFFIKTLDNIFDYHFYYDISDAIPNNYAKYRTRIRSQEHTLPTSVNLNITKDLGISTLELIITQHLFHKNLPLEEMHLQRAHILSNTNLHKIAQANDINMYNEKENANLIKILVGMIYIDQSLQGKNHA